MHPALPALLCLLLATLPLSAQDQEPPKRELTKIVEFELGLWQSRLGLKEVQMRELRYAAKGAVATVRAVTNAADDEEAEADEWEKHKTDREPWSSMRLPRALKAKSFIEVASAVLSKKQITNLVRMKQQLKSQRKSNMATARAYQRAALLTADFALTESQSEKVVELMIQRALDRRQLVEKFKGREDQIPSPKPLRKDPSFLAILDQNQKKLLTEPKPDGKPTDNH